MEAIKLEFQPNLKSKILDALSAFSSDELRIVPEESDFEIQKRHLHSVSAKIDNGTAEYCTFDELEAELDEIISQYEN